MQAVKDFKLDFVAVGPQRTGTSWLDRVLKEHPSLCLPQYVKETMFFDKYYEKGMAWYTAHYLHYRDGQLRGEIGSTYFDSVATADRIYRLNPDCKIIVTLRHPLARALSLYRHYLALGYLQGSFSEAATQNPRIVDAGKYSTHIPRWIDRFGKEQVLIVLLEEIEIQPERAMARIYDFLGVEEIELPPVAREKYGAGTMPRFPLLAKLITRCKRFLRANRWHQIVELGKMAGLRTFYTGGEKHFPGLSVSEEAELLRIYEEDTVYVESLIGKDLSAWRQPLSAEYT